jgi:hypothetical protein
VKNKNSNNCSDELVEKFEKLLKYIIKRPDDGSAWNDLLPYFSDGISPEYLRCLLYSDNEKLISGATWLISELGNEATILIDDMEHFLEYPELGVRYWSLNYFISVSNTYELSKHHILKILSILENKYEDELVKSTAMLFVSYAPIKILYEIFHDMENQTPQSYHCYALKLFLKNINKIDEIEKLLTDKELLVRIYMAIAASNHFITTPKLLLKALLSRDKEIKRFATRKYSMVKYKHRKDQKCNL